MKKTLITLLALAGIAVANPTVYTDVEFVNQDESGALTSTRSHIVFGEESLTLYSWMIEFSITKFSDSGTFLNFTPATASKSESAGLALRTQGDTDEEGNDGVGIMFHSGTAYLTGEDTDATYKILVPDTVSEATPLTLRVAYDATTTCAYLYDVTDGEFVCIETNLEPTLSSVTAGKTDQNGMTQFYTLNSSMQFNNVTVVDMDTMAGNTSEFENYIKTFTVPEPATATLSLLALAGLAARRRRS